MASTSTITSLGVGSGLDAESIVTKLVALERQPIKQLQTQSDKLQTKISAFGNIKSSVSSLLDAARRLTNVDTWSATTSTSADSSTVSFSTSTGAATGNFSVTVSSLAASQSVVMKTALSTPTSTLGAGTLIIDTGTWNGTDFKASSKPLEVPIAATDTLSDIRDKINASGAGAKASIITDASGARLVMSSASPGASNGFRVQVNGDTDGTNSDASGLSMLAYDAPDASGVAAGTRLTQAASNAAATINGVAVTSTSNKFSDVLTGISLTVGKLTAPGSSVNVTIAQDNETIKKAITDFTAAYSSLNTLLKDNTKYDESTKTAGTLQGDGTALALLNQFRYAISASSGASATFATLSSVGITLQSGGSLKVDDTKLSNALGNVAELKKLFANADSGNASNDGVATRMRTLANDVLSSEGALSSRTTGLNTTIKANQKRQDELDARAALYEKRLRAQYTALDTKMASISTTSSYVAQMINSLNRSS